MFSAKGLGLNLFASGAPAVFKPRDKIPFSCRCGSFNWHVSGSWVLGQPRITELKCLQCDRVAEIDPHAYVQTPSHIEDELGSNSFFRRFPLKKFSIIRKNLE